MSAQDLSYSEIVSVTVPWTAGPVSDWWRAHPVGLMFSAELDRLRAIVVRAPAESSEAGRINARLAEIDADHDAAVRFITETFDAYQHHVEPAVRAEAAELRALLASDGTKLVNASYGEEAGRHTARERVLTPEIRARVARFHLAEPGPSDLLAYLQGILQPAAAEIGRLLEARASISATSEVPAPSDLLDAKRELIHVVEQVFTTFRILERTLGESDRIKVRALRDGWSDAVRSATERARRRRAGETPVTPAT